VEIIKFPNVKDRKGYARNRVLESLFEVRLSIKMLKDGYSRNSANKIFLAWKAFISALVTLNLDKLGKDEKQKEWYNKIGFCAPTTGIKGITQELEDLGYKDLSNVTSTALLLHSYAYNGIYKGITNYSSKEEAIRDIIKLTKFILDNITSFKDIWDNELEEEYTKSLNEFKELLSK